MAKGYALVGLRLIGVVAGGYLALVVGNLSAAFVARTMGPAHIRVVGALLCGLVVGCLTALLRFRNRGLLLAAVIASVPVLFSWFARGLVQPLTHMCTVAEASMQREEAGSCTWTS